MIISYRFIENLKHRRTGKFYKGLVDTIELSQIGKNKEFTESEITDLRRFRSIIPIHTSWINPQLKIDANKRREKEAKEAKNVRDVKLSEAKSYIEDHRAKRKKRVKNEIHN